MQIIISLILCLSGLILCIGQLCMLPYNTNLTSSGKFVCAVCFVVIALALVFLVYCSIREGEENSNKNV